MLKNRKKLIITIGIIAVVLIVLYFAVLMPILSRGNGEGEVPELLPGEILGLNNRIMLFENIDQSNLKEVEVHNETGTYAFYKPDGGGDYLVKGIESAPFSKTMFSSLVVSAGYTLTMDRVDKDCQDLSIYGLDDASVKTWYSITSDKGNKYTVYIGDMIPTGAGYYVRCEGRNAVYILSSDISSSLMKGLKSYIEPILTLNLDSSDYYTVNDFFIFHKDECVVWIDYAKDEINTDQPTTSPYKMIGPKKYVPSTTYETLLTKFQWFSGVQVLEIQNADTPIADEVLLKYNIDPSSPEWSLHYTYKGFESLVWISPKADDGYYYAYTHNFNMIVKVDAATLDFLDWDFIKYVDDNLFTLDINDVSKIEIRSKEINETFILEGEGQTIKVTPSSTKKTFDSTDLQNFRQFYKTLLGIKMQNYAEDTSAAEPVLTFKVTTDSMVTYEFVFYRYASRKCYYTLNGKGDFYVLYDAVEKVITDAQKVMNGEAIDSWAKS